MKIQLSDHFTLKKIFLFTFPSIIMMIFTSIYTVVDGIFIARFVGSNALTAIGIVMPLFTVIGAFGFMLGAGGSAEVARKIGENKSDIAKSDFSILTMATTILGIFFSIITITFMEPICYLLGATVLVIEECITYGTISMLAVTFFMLQSFFQSFFVVAEKPKIGLVLTIAGGVTNMILDWLFVAKMNMEIAGAAYATLAGAVVGSIIPIIYFCCKNSSRLNFVIPKFNFKVLIKSSINGSSEMISNVSMALTTFLFNIQLMKMLGEPGVAAISIIGYANFIFIATFIGFAIGIAPVISYHYGAKNEGELKLLYKKCLGIISVISLMMFVCSELGGDKIVTIFSKGDLYLEKITINGFKLFAISFLFCGFNIFSSAFFTALCNGKVSAIISFFRTLLLQVATIMLLPIFFKEVGIWLALPLTELLAFMFSMYFLIRYKKRYGY